MKRGMRSVISLLAGCPLSYYGQFSGFSTDDSQESTSTATACRHAGQAVTGSEHGAGHDYMTDTDCFGQWPMTDHLPPVRYRCPAPGRLNGLRQGKRLRERPGGWLIQ